MPRWYAARKCVGSPDTIVHQVSQLVRQYDLGRVLPLIRIERRPRGQFYVFLGIESEAPGELPPELAPLREYPVIKTLERGGDSAHIQPFTLDEIQKMVTGEISVHDYARRLTVHLPAPLAFADPFPPGDTEDAVNRDDLLDRSQRYDRLLLWMSAAGCGTFASLQSACNTLGLDPDATGTGRILRRLRLLGHVETSADGARWSVAPLLLTRVTGPAGEPGYVLCGGRDSTVLAALHREASIQVTPQSGGDAPARIYVATSDAGALATSLSVACVDDRVRVDDAAARLSEALPTLERWMDMLTPLPEVKPELFDVRIYRGATFVDALVERSGFYELWPREAHGTKAGRPRYTLFYDAISGYWLRGDWYGLRYLARIQNDEVCPVTYDLLSGRLAIPVEWRPPELFERAFVLCSGRLPVQHNGWLFYDDIEPTILNTLAAKLRMTLQENLVDA